MEKQDEEFILTMKQGIQIGRSLVQILLTLVLTLTVFCYGSYVITGRATDADFYIQLADRAQERDGFYDQIYQNADQILQSRGALSSLPQTVFENVLIPGIYAPGCGRIYSGNGGRDVGFVFADGIDGIDSQPVYGISGAAPGDICDGAGN